MSFSFQRIRAHARFGLRSLAVATLLWPAVCLGAPDPDKISVYVDQAKLLKLPAKVATIIVGNPLIADVTLQSGGIVVVTGKGYGATNFIAMDRAGDVLVDRQIQVEGPTERSSPSTAASNANPTAARRFASAGSRSATARIISRRRSTRPARSPARPRARRLPAPNRPTELASTALSGEPAAGSRKENAPRQEAPARRGNAGAGRSSERG